MIILLLLQTLMNCLNLIQILIFKQSELDTEIINALLHNPRPEFIIESHNINRGRHILFNTRKRRREHTRLSIDNIITKI